MTIKTERKMYADEQNRAFSAESESGRMSRHYYLEAEKLARYREKLMAQRRERPACEDLHKLDLRIDILYSEICDLRSTALHLRRLAEKKPPTPSLASRARSRS